MAINIRLLEANKDSDRSPIDATIGDIKHWKTNLDSGLVNN